MANQKEIQKQMKLLVDRIDKIEDNTKVIDYIKNSKSLKK
jgi:hypothetical protein